MSSPLNIPQIQIHQPSIRTIHNSEGIILEYKQPCLEEAEAEDDVNEVEEQPQHSDSSEDDVLLQQ